GGRRRCGQGCSPKHPRGRSARQDHPTTQCSVDRMGGRSPWKGRRSWTIIGSVGLRHGGTEVSSMSPDEEMRLLEIFSEALGTDPKAVTDESSPETLATWTSLNHLLLMSSIEEQFGLTLGTDEMLQTSTFGGLRELVARHARGGTKNSVCPAR